MATYTPSGNNELLGEAVLTRKSGRLERFLGPDNYRVLQGLFKTPASVTGLMLILWFVIVALMAPVLAPPLNPNDPYTIPRDGFKAQPRPPGTEWRVNPPPLPFWWRTVTGRDTWIHLFGTSQGQYDIYYGVIWGTRTAFKAGLIVVFSTVLLGIIVGSVSAYYGGAVDNIIMRIVDVFLTLPFILAALILAAVLWSRRAGDTATRGLALPVAVAPLHNETGDTTLCSGACIDRYTNVNNCGSCGNRCSGGQACSNGACGCPMGQTTVTSRAVSCAATQARSSSGAAASRTRGAAAYQHGASAVERRPQSRDGDQGGRAGRRLRRRSRSVGGSAARAAVRRPERRVP